MPGKLQMGGKLVVGTTVAGTAGLGLYVWRRDVAPIIRRFKACCLHQKRGRARID